MPSPFAALAAEAASDLFAEFGEPATYTPAGGAAVPVTAIFTEEKVPPLFGEGVLTTKLRIDLRQSEVAVQPTDGATVLRASTSKLHTVRTSIPDAEGTVWECHDVQG